MTMEELHVGHVEDVSPKGFVIAVLRRVPSGEDSTEVFLWSSDPTPEPGDEVAVWRWQLLHPDGTFEPKQHIKHWPVSVPDDLAKELDGIREELAQISIEEVMSSSSAAGMPDVSSATLPFPGADGAPASSAHQRASRPEIPFEHVSRLEPKHLNEGEAGLVVFGPGTGEAMVIKLPNGEFGVIDGCAYPDPGRPDGAGDPVREFLNGVPGLDRDGEGSLAFVCWTHPHEDHYKGMMELLQTYGAGRLRHFFSIRELTGRVGKLLQTIARHPEYANNSELCRLGELLAVVRAMDPHVYRELGQAVLVHQDLRHGSLLRACGPIDADFRDVVLRMASLGPDGRLAMNPASDPNRLSGALHLEWRGTRMLLGGDLLACDGAFQGWSAVDAYVRRPTHVVKAPHHASEGARDAALWTALRPDLVVVTPFMQAGGAQPPRPSDIRAILAGGAKVVITSPPQWVTDDGTTPHRCWVGRSHRQDPEGGRPRHNAVAISLNDEGEITRVVLAGRADRYAVPAT